MTRHGCIVVLVVAAGCGTPPGVVGTPPPSDAGGDGAQLPPSDAIDAGGDAAIDARPPPRDLAEMCGRVPASFDDWERCYKQRWCEAMVGCVPQSGYRDVQECLDRSNDVESGRLGAELHDRARAVAQGRASIDVPAFTQCLFDTGADRCTTVWSSAACATRFTGTIADGASCFTNIDCASPGATCDAGCTEACCAGTCRPRFREHQACDLFDSCEPGLMCHGTCRSGDIGAGCGSDRDCDANAWCSAGRCVADLAPGAPCTNPLQCGGQTSCVGLSVGASPGHCMSISRPGDRCDYFCYGQLYCDGSICRNLPQLGQACSGLAACGGVDAVCSDGVCALRDGAGASCSTSRTCRVGLFCTSELNDPRPRCAARRAPGQPCTAPSHCDSYLCSGTAEQPGTCLSPSDSCVTARAAPN